MLEIQFKSMLYWDLTQRLLVVDYLRFGTTYRSHLQGTSSKDLMTFEEGIQRLSRNVDNKQPIYAA
jgi:hypothetical protein